MAVTGSIERLTLAPMRDDSSHARIVQRDGTQLFTPRQVFLPLAAACAIGVFIIGWLARDRGVATAAELSFAGASVLSMWLATSTADGPKWRYIIAVAALGASAALPGWFFGPSSAYAGILAILLLFSGLLMGGVGTPFPAAAAWAVYIGIAGGQLAIAVLVFVGLLRDASLMPLVPPHAVAWHHVACHITVQFVYVAAFAIGRALHHRYWAVAEALERGMRSAARRDALLDEARAEYRRNFALGRAGIFAGHTLGRYRLGGLIGRGGAGEVYDARDLVDGSLVAVKLLRGDRLDDPTQVRGFIEEATALVQIDSPHVVRAHHIGGIEDALPYIAMERLDGPTLAQLLPLDRAGLRQLIEDGCAALDAVHRAGICHGDINPNNLVRVNGRWKLIDFGAMRSDVVGTPGFVAPERIAGERGPSVDLYGLCASILAATSGESEFSRALERGLTDRYPDAIAMRDMLLAVVDTARDAQPSVLPVEPIAVHVPRASSPSFEQISAWRGAFADKMKLQYMCVWIACIAGATLIASIAHGPKLWLGLGTIAAAAIVVALARRGDREWPWIVVGALAIGPAYVLGLHSGFAAVIAVTLFVESSFRSSETGCTGRGWTLVAVLFTNAVAFTLVATRVIPDGQVTTVLHHPPWAAIVIELLILGIYGCAFSIGHIVYTRYAELVRTNERAARDAAAQEALLATARAEITRVLDGYSGGLFTGSKIGAYDVEALIGRGGMGEVYAARRGDQRVAVKVIRSDRIANTRILRRFAREAETLLRVDSQYVARVLDVGTEDGRLPFLVMELVEGTSLADQLRTDPLDLATVRTMVRDIARGLADCHRAGVIHRDVKPHNLVLTSVDGAINLRAAPAALRGPAEPDLSLTKRPLWKLVDFGIAKLPSHGKTTGGVIVGTPAYMSPEQLAGGDVDVRSDLYSLCLVLYRVLAGRPAFTNTRAADAVPPDPMRIANLPMDLRYVLRKGLAAAPRDRFASAIELEAAFDAAFEGRLDPRYRTT